MTPTEQVLRSYKTFQRTEVINGERIDVGERQIQYAVMEAAKNPDTSVIVYVIDHGFDPKGDNAFFFATCMLTSHPDVIDVFHSKGFDFMRRSLLYYRTPFMAACTYNPHVHVIKRILVHTLTNAADVMYVLDMEDKDNYNALQLAYLHNTPDVMMFVLELFPTTSLQQTRLRALKDVVLPTGRVNVNTRANEKRRVQLENELDGQKNWQFKVLLVMICSMIVIGLLIILLST
jgi:hypothetical protein